MIRPHLLSIFLFVLPVFVVAQETDSEVFEYTVGEEDLNSIPEPAHDHSSHAHDHAGHNHSDSHAGHDHSDHSGGHNHSDHAGHDHGHGAHSENGAHDHSGHLHEEEAVNWMTGQGVNVGGFIFPELFVIGTGGVFEKGGTAEDFSTSGHDPQNDIGMQGIELHLEIDFDEVVTGRIAGFGNQGPGEVWEAEIEEAYLHYHISENLSIGGGRFLNTVGFQNNQHLHVWDFINQNLVNSRMLNEGEFTTEGGEATVRFPNIGGILTIGAGGVRTHAHDHDHGHGDEDHEEHEEHEDEDHDEDEHDHEEEHLEIDNANFNDWALSLDYKFHLPGDKTTTLSASFVTGENGFGEQTYVYGGGIEKLWQTHAVGNDSEATEFGAGTIRLRSEIMAREFTAIHEDGDALKLDDYGLSTNLHYGLTDRATLGLRHDWISELEEAELTDRQRISPSMTVHLGAEKQLRARIQYDYTHDESLESEHAAWLQFQWTWGGGAHGHGHSH